MIDAVFISDLHLDPKKPEILVYFDAFIQWAKFSVKTIYILGDFFHAWAGDDALDDWSRGIAKQLHEVSAQGVSLFYMHGNRDFLLGETFAKLAGWTILAEPSVIQLGDKKILLVHGDCYCIKDKSHQRFRLLTRNRVFTRLFLALPLKYRQGLVTKVRSISQNNQHKSLEQMDVVESEVVKDLEKYKINTVIHGHTHQPGLTVYASGPHTMSRYVLSDWDDIPKLLCYDNTIGSYFDRKWFLRRE